MIMSKVIFRDDEYHCPSCNQHLKWYPKLEETFYDKDKKIGSTECINQMILMCVNDGCKYFATIFKKYESWDEENWDEMELPESPFNKT